MYVTHIDIPLLNSVSNYAISELNDFKENEIIMFTTS
jgi:hypothetical protein